MILAQAFQRFAFDLDGVIWRAGEAIAGAPETVQSLRAGGKRVCFVTNNSSQTAESYARALAKIGAPCDPADVISSADATARVLASVPGARGRLAYVIGGEGLLQAVRSVGMRPAEDADAVDASVVVVGWDQKLTYQKLKLASLAIQRGAMFVASNTDATYPAPDGFWPGGGAIVAALRTATGVGPVVAGKPEPILLEVARERLDGDPVLFVGDRVETDVAAADAAGWPSALVLSGASGVPDLAVAPCWPTFLLLRLTDMLRDLPHPEVRPATGPDLPAVATLLHDGGLMSGAARERVGRTLVAEADRTVIGTAAWDVLAGQVGLLRSVAVAPAVRGTGVGTLVVAAAIRRLAAEGAREVYLATESADDFFGRCGFERVDRAEAPDPVLEHPQVARECSTSAAVMRLRVPEVSRSTGTAAPVPAASAGTGTAAPSRR